jgi:hypothetical protein
MFGELFIIMTFLGTPIGANFCMKLQMGDNIQKLGLPTALVMKQQKNSPIIKRYPHNRNFMPKTSL